MGRNKFQIDFIGIGAEKAGTTWIADCLMEHPEVCFSKEKEVLFFNEYDPHYLEVQNVKYEEYGMDWYVNQFAHCSTGAVVGEFSPTYMYDNQAAHRIQTHFPDTKLLVVLREPSSRAFSQYIHDQRIGLIKDINFTVALEQFPNYRKKGFYAEALEQWFDLFPKENIFVTLLDDITERPEAVLKDLFRFLKLRDVDFTPSVLQTKSNRAQAPRFAFLNYFMMHTEYFLRNNGLSGVHKFLVNSGLRTLALKLRDVNSKPLDRYPTIQKDVQQQLQQEYSKDVAKLEELIGRDLNAWK